MPINQQKIGEFYSHPVSYSNRISSAKYIDSYNPSSVSAEHTEPHLYEWMKDMKRVAFGHTKIGANNENLLVALSPLLTKKLTNPVSVNSLEPAIDLINLMSPSGLEQKNDIRLSRCTRVPLNYPESK